MQTGSATKFRIKDTDKTEAWHKEMHDHFLSRSQDAGRADMEKSYAYYQGIVDPEFDHNHLISHESGNLSPIDFIHYNEILPSVHTLLGENSMEGTERSVIALSKLALSRKREKMIRFDVDYKMMPLLQQEQESYGMPLISEDMPMTKEELDEKKRNYKEEGEIVFQRILENWIAKYNWAGMRHRLMEDVIVAGRCFAQSSIEGTFPRPVVLDPRKVIFDQSIDSPWLEDAGFVGSQEYISLARAREMFNLNDEEVKKITGSGSSNVFGSIGVSGTGGFNQVSDFNGEQHVLLTRVEWKDTRDMVGLEYESKKGTKHFQIMDKEISPEDKKKKIDSERKRSKAKSQKPMAIEIVRTCIVLGGVLTVQYGELENMVRTTDDWQTTGYSIEGFLPNWKFGQNVSMVKMMMPIQKLLNESLYQLRKAFKKDKGKFWLSDVSQLPDGFTMLDQAYFADIIGQAPINSKSDGINAGYNQYQAIDMSLPPSVKIYIEVAMWCRDALSRISGVTDVRQGNMLGSAQAVGVTEISRRQSIIRTEALFSNFAKFEEKFLRLVLGQLKMCYAKYPDKFSHIVGDEGIQFLLQDIDLNLDDYGAVVTSKSVSQEIKAITQEMTVNAVNNGHLPFDEGLDILIEGNPRDAALMVKRAFGKRKEEERKAKQAEQMELQQQRELQRELSDAQSKMEAAKQQELNQIALEKERIKGETAMGVKSLDTKSKDNLGRQKMETDILKSLIAKKGDVQKKPQK